VPSTADAVVTPPRRRRAGLPSPPRPRAGRPSLQRRAAALVLGPVVGLALAATVARADAQRLVLGTHDPALAAALSVAVSPRGLSVVELPDALARVGDAAVARREVGVPGTVAVVWLCDDDAGAHALCFCGPDGRITVKALSVTSPLTPPDAAAVALSVKMMLGAPRPAPPPEAAAPAPPPAAAAPAPPPDAATPGPGAAPAPVSRVAPVLVLPALALEVDVGARLQSPADGHVGFRAGAKGALALESFGRALGGGLGFAGGPALVASAPAGRTVSDWSVEAFALGRRPIAPAWLELELGPQLHFLSVAAGPSTTSRVALALDALAGAVAPVGPLLLGVRAGGFVVVATSPMAKDGTTPVSLPQWNGEVMLTLGFALR
jgi:hypothetical protein